VARPGGSLWVGHLLHAQLHTANGGGSETSTAGSYKEHRTPSMQGSDRGVARPIGCRQEARMSCWDGTEGGGP
jgi:hypothetical protein